MNIAKAIGIFAILCSHVGFDIGGKFISSSSWQVPIFFFISGYFCYKIEYIESWRQLIKILTHKVSKYLSWFYFYNSIYAIITIIIYKYIGKLWGGLPNFKMLTFGAISYVQFGIASPIWFLSQLAISIFIFYIIIFSLKSLKRKNTIYSIIFILLAIIAIIISKDNFEESFGKTKLLIRTFLSLYYMYIGYIFKLFFESHFKYNFKNFSILILIQLIVITLCPNYVISLSQAQIYHNITPLITPLTGIFLVLFLSKFITTIFSKENFIDKLGKTTLHVMTNHVFILFFIQICLLLAFHMPLKNAEIMTDMWKIESFRWLYIILGTIISVYTGSGIEKILYLIKKGHKTW